MKTFYEKSDDLARVVLGQKKETTDEGNGGFFASLLSSDSSRSSKGNFSGNNISIGSNNWGPTSIGGGGRRGDNRGTAVVLGSAVALASAFFLGRFLKEYNINKENMATAQEDIGNDIATWKKTSILVNNPHFVTIEKIYNRTMALYNQKANNGLWNLGLTVGFVASGVFLAAGAIVSVDVLMIGGGIGLLGTGVVTLIRVGYRSIGDNPEQRIARDIRTQYNLLSSGRRAISIDF